MIGPEAGAELALFADCFNRYFEPANMAAAVAVLGAAGRCIRFPPAAGGRPLCCGRTYLAAGMVDEARAEAARLLAALGPLAARGVPVVGLEPACLLTLRDELPALVPGAAAEALAEKALMFEEYLAREHTAGRLDLDLNALPAGRALVHGHCHQKAFAAMGAVEQTLRLVPGLEVEMIESTCCGMAGAFGYQAETYKESVAMGELSLLPAVRAAAPETLIVADGTSCRHQIADLTDSGAQHVARVLQAALEG